MFIRWIIYLYRARKIGDNKLTPTTFYPTEFLTTDENRHSTLQIDNVYNDKQRLENWKKIYNKVLNINRSRPNITLLMKLNSILL